MPNSIVVGTDGSDTATKAVREAVVMASALGATLDIVSAYAPPSAAVQRRAAAHVSGGRMAPEDVQWALNPHEDIEACLTEAADIAREAGVNVNTYARQGDPADAILDVAQEQDARLVIVGNKGMTGAKRFLMGSVPNNVAHQAPCTVMIVRTT
jgi:nucleotide-binding universal stress UspA family protein